LEGITRVEDITMPYVSGAALDTIAEELIKLNKYLEASAGIQELKESLDEMNLSIRALGTSFEDAFESIFIKQGEDHTVDVKKQLKKDVIAHNHFTAQVKKTKKKINFICVDCGEPQFETPSGRTCKNGHGGAASIEPLVCSACGRGAPEASGISDDGVDFYVCVDCDAIVCWPCLQSNLDINSCPVCTNCSSPSLKKYRKEK
jgi:hypothetical protein